jgi:hypothetical protein
LSCSQATLQEQWPFIACLDYVFISQGVLLLLLPLPLRLLVARAVLLIG